MGWGDELMVTGHARVLQEKDPRRVRVIYEKPRWHEAWNNNPRIALPDEKGDFQEYRARENYLRPYCVEKRHDRWRWKRYGPPRGELYFSDDEIEFGRRHAGRIILEPRLKQGASPNKNWGWVRWCKLGWILQEKHGLRLTQLGGSVAATLDGAETIRTDNMRLAAAVIANARAVVVPEGGLHHVAAAVNTPAVVIFGGYISPEVTGYPDQINLFTGGGFGCGMRSECGHCKEAMAKISPEEVAEKLIGVLSVPTSRNLAA